MQAVILAGGRGTRLAPYTTVFPKPLVPIADKPILEIIIRQLANFGIHDVTLSVGYLAELIQAYFYDGNKIDPRIKIRYVSEDHPLGTAGSLTLIDGLKDTFLVMNGDVLTSLDYGKLIKHHQTTGAALTIAMHSKRVKIDLGVLELGSDHAITGYVEKPELAYSVSMGIYVYEPRVMRYIEPGCYLDFPNLVLTLLQNGERVVGFPCSDYWLDIGRPEDYATAVQEFERNKEKFNLGYLN